MGGWGGRCRGDLVFVRAANAWLAKMLVRGVRRGVGRGRGVGRRVADLVLVRAPNAWLAILPRLAHHTVVVIRCDVSLIAFTLSLLAIQCNARPCKVHLDPDNFQYLL